MMPCSCEREIEIAEAVNKCFLVDQTHTTLWAPPKNSFNILRAVVFSINLAYFAFAVIFNLSCISPQGYEQQALCILILEVPQSY